MSFFEELKRRNVFRVGIAYVVAAWLLLQLTDVLVGLLELPDVIGKFMVLLLVIGLIPALIFAWAFEMTPEGIKREHEVDRTQSITPQTGKKLNFMIIGVMALAIVYFVVDKFVLSADRMAAPIDAVVQEAPVTAEPSIAVLPFVNMSSDAEQEFFSDGISEEILNALAKINKLKVAGRTSSFAFKGENQDLRVIGEALGVNHILEGSVRKSGNQVRITAQLIQVEDGFHLWSETYDRELTNVFKIQDEIATAILEQLKLQLLDTEKLAMVAVSTDTEAYEKYLLAKQRIYDRNRLSLEAAVQLLDAAIAIDPDYAPALAQRGIAVLLLVDEQYGDIPREQVQPLGKGFLDRALLLNPELAEAWAGMGLYFLGEPAGHEEAIKALERATALNPSMIDASNWLQIAYGNAGMTGKVLPILEGMLERDPLYRPAIGNAVNEFNRLGMQDRSLSLLERVRPFIPDDAHLVNYKANTLLSLGRNSEALPLFEEAVRRHPSDGLFKQSLGFGLWNTHQYERMLDPNFPPFIRAFALDTLDRSEEAIILAYEIAARGFPGPLLVIMLRAGRYAETVKYVEERWIDLDTYEADFPHGSSNHWMMMHMAVAYSKTGNEEKFTDAMTRVRQAHDQLISEGVQDNFFYWQEAAYFTLAQNHDKAIEQLGIAIDKGANGNLRIAKDDPAFEALEGDPRFEALQLRMINNLNQQRAELNLEPASI